MLIIRIATVGLLGLAALLALAQAPSIDGPARAAGMNKASMNKERHATGLDRAAGTGDAIKPYKENLR